MIFWLGILAGAVAAWAAIRIGFYESWVMLFNILISIYVAIFLTPVIVDIVPEAGGISCGNILAMTAVAIAVFAILYGIAHIFFTSQFNVSFPKTFDILFAGLLGFLAGFLVLSFAAFLICATPISQNEFASDAGLSRQSQRANISYICWWCDLVNSVVASPENKVTTEQAINEWLSGTEPKAPPETAEDTEPGKPAESNDAGTSIGEENLLSSPPGAAEENP